MAKKKQAPIKTFSIQGWDINHYKTTDAYVAAIDRLYNTAIEEFAKLTNRVKIDPDKPFSFADYPATQATAQKIVNELAANMQTVIANGSLKQWLYACQKNDAFLRSIMDTTKISKARLNKMQDRNLDALKIFQQRKVDGLDLSGRVWKYVGQFKDQIELGLDVGLGEGRSAQQLARDVKENLNDPDRLFRRVRDKGGVLRLSKAAKAFHPGRGVYRSSTKNAQRLTRSEINMSYRESDRLRWESLDFVVGFEIRRSNKEPKCKCKLCERLKGKYPKSFVFKGWHPQCMCFAVPILQDYEEMREDRRNEFRAALYGTEYKKYASKNTVTDVPVEFKKWVSENKEASKDWKSTPYFIKDNFTGGTLAGDLKLVKPIIIPPKETKPIEPPKPEVKETKVVEDVKEVSPNMPKELAVDGGYTKDTGIEFKKEFFDLIDPKKTVVMHLRKDIKGSMFRPFDKTVHIADNARIRQSLWEREAVIYHEFGHAIDWQRNLRFSEPTKNLMDKHRKLLSAKATRNVYVREYDFDSGKFVYVKKAVKMSNYAYIDRKLQDLIQKVSRMESKTFTRLGITKHDVLEQIGSTRDTIMSLNPNYGYGHSKAYFKNPGMKETEFLAHAFENAFATNSVFKKYLPDLYNEMIQFVKGLK